MPSVSVRINGINGASSESGSTASSSEGSTASGSSSEATSESSSSSSSSEAAEGDVLRRADLVARLEEMRQELNNDRAAIHDAAGDLMPVATHCATLADVMAAWNDALATLLADARGACEDARAEDTYDDDDEPPFRMYGDEGFMLHIDADPVDYSNLDTEVAEARARAEAYGAECADQLAAAVSSHDLLVECLDKEAAMAAAKCDTDVRSVEYGVRQLEAAAAATLEEQRGELEAQQAMVADLRARVPPPTLTAEAAELRATLSRLPAALPDRDAWLAQLSHGAGDREVALIVSAAQRAVTPMPQDVWARLSAAAQHPDTPPAERARNLDALERAVLALETPRDARDALEDVRGQIRLALARRQAQRTEVATGISVATREFSHRLSELFDEYCALHGRVLDVVRDLLHATQARWQAAVANLQRECFAPLQELGLPFAKATMSTPCLVAYQRLTAVAQKDLDVRRKAHVIALARHAVDAVPRLHDALQTLRDLPGGLMTGAAAYK
jgi:hypothetical protein